METGALQQRNQNYLERPHSLGKSVEWKREIAKSQAFAGIDVPTRWGNQLNGNNSASAWIRSRSCSPHSLGKSVEWKRNSERRNSGTALDFCPTRWENQRHQVKLIRAIASPKTLQTIVQSIARNVFSSEQFFSKCDTCCNNLITSKNRQTQVKGSLLKDYCPLKAATFLTNSLLRLRECQTSRLIL